MSVYVRLITGAEDCYKAVAYEATEWVCLETEDDPFAEGFYRHIGWNYKNPSVHEGADGSLEVRSEGKKLGRYPTGAWLSWRSD